MQIKSILNHQLLILSTVIYLVSCGKKTDKTIASAETILDQKTIVKTVSVRQSSATASINVLGLVISDKEAKPSFKTGGVIAKTFLKEGDAVRKGQLLATLVMSEIDAQVRQAEEGLNKAERDMNRVKHLYTDSVATLEQFQNSTTMYEMARRSVEIAKFNKEYSEVRSPINGRIAKQIMHEGEITAPGTPVYAILGTGSSDWKIKAGLIDRDWARVKIGDLGQLNLDAYPGKVYEAIVSEKSVIGGNASSTIDIELKFKSPPQNLAAGLIGKLSIHPKNKDVNTMTLPIEVLVNTNGNDANVFIVENGKAKKTAVKIGPILGESVEVIAGLTPNQAIVTIGAMYLEDGDAVEVRN
jgi:membrane fusion protein, multidrug efflux system